MCGVLFAGLLAVVSGCGGGGGAAAAAAGPSSAKPVATSPATSAVVEATPQLNDSTGDCAYLNAATMQKIMGLSGVMTSADPDSQSCNYVDEDGPGDDMASLSVVKAPAGLSPAATKSVMVKDFVQEEPEQDQSVAGVGDWAEFGKSSLGDEQMIAGGYLPTRSVVVVTLAFVDATQASSTMMANLLKQVVSG